MHPPVSAEKKEAMRQLRELLPPTFAKLATIAGIHVTTLRDIAARENWPKLHAPHGTVMQVVRKKDLEEAEAARERAEALEALADQLVEPPPGDIAALLVAELRSVLALMQAGRIEKSRIDTLLSVIKLAERLEKLPPETGNAAGQEEQKRSDDELAEILARVDERIIELARDYAERLVAERADGEAG